MALTDKKLSFYQMKDRFKKAIISFRSNDSFLEAINSIIKFSKAMLNDVLNQYEDKELHGHIEAYHIQDALWSAMKEDYATPPHAFTIDKLVGEALTDEVNRIIGVNDE